MFLGRIVNRFLKNLSPPVLREEDVMSTLNMKAAGTNETSFTIY
jgi:hypothetical protein